MPTRKKKKSNGTVTDEHWQKRHTLGLVGDRWVKNWGFSARAVEVVTEEKQPLRLRLKDGTIYTFLRLPTLTNGASLKGVINASGSGRLEVVTSTCLRPPVHPGLQLNRSFSHDIKKKTGPFELNDEPATYHFSIDFDAYEQGYLYIYAHGEAFLTHVSAVPDKR